VNDADVIVVGAGVAGLTAARHLAEAGRSVLLLEAHDRAGGRILTSGDGVELGAEFIHGSPTSTLGLLAEAGVGTIEVAGGTWVGENGRIDPANWGEGSHDVHLIMRLVDRLQVDMSVEAFLRSAVDQDAALVDGAAAVRERVRGFDAADPRRASIKAIAAEWRGDASIESEARRPRGGYAALIDHMGRALRPERVDVRYGSVVRAIKWKTGSVEVDVARGAHVEQARARAIVVTVSIGVLCLPIEAEGALRFDPPLALKRSALAGLAMGPALKVMLRFSDPFWERIDGGRYADASFFFAGRDATFRTIWTAHPARTPWLSAWLGGPSAAMLSEQRDEVVAERAVASVQSLFGQRLRIDDALVETRLHNWQTDPFIRGAYSYTTVGGLSARRELAAPIDRTLFFAGEATGDSSEATTIGGAIASGERAAREVVAAM
jgi:monoamine oxidase